MTQRKPTPFTGWEGVTIQLDITEAQSKKLAFYKLAFNFRTKADAVRYILDHASKSKIEV